MATSTANIVSSLSAGSGVDIRALAESLVEAEKAPRADAIQARIDKSNAKISGYGAVSYGLNALKSAFDGLRDVSDYSSISASNSQSSAFGVTADATAATGSYDITVNQVAKGQRSVSASTFSTSSDTLNGGAAMAFTLTLGGTEHAIAVAAGNDTPAGIVVAINEANIGVSAQLINTGSGYKVVLTGPEGADQAFSLEVGQRDFSATYADATAALNGGQAMSLLLDNGAGGTQAVAVAAGSDTLDGIVDAINASMGAGYASKGGTAGAETLVLSSGTVQDVTGFVLDATALQSAQDASFTVNGLTVTRTSNTVDDVIDGVTLNLYTATTGSARVDLARDTSDVKARLQDLVLAYNDFADTLDVLGNRDSDVEVYGGALAGESFLVTVKAQVRALITTTSDSAGDNIQAFRDIGISFDRYGAMTFDEGKFDTAAASNYDEIITMMTADTEAQSVYSTAPAGAAGDAYTALDVMLRSTGLIAARTSNAEEDVTKQEQRMTDLEDRYTRVLDRYLQQFAVMDSLVGSLKKTGEGLTSTFEGMMAMYTKK